MHLNLVGNDNHPEQKPNSSLDVSELLTSYEKEHGILETVKFICTRLRGSIYEADQLKNTSGDLDKRINTESCWRNAAYTTLNLLSDYISERGQSAGIDREQYQQVIAVEILLNKNARDTMNTGRRNEQFYTYHTYTQRQLVALGIQSPKLLEGAFDTAVDILKTTEVFTQNSDGGVFINPMVSDELISLYKEITGLRAELLGHSVLRDVAQRMTAFIRSRDFKQHIAANKEDKHGYTVGEHIAYGTRGSGKVFVESSKPADDRDADMDFYIGIEVSGEKVRLLGIDVKTSDNADEGAFVLVDNNTPDKNGKSTIPKKILYIPRTYVKKSFVLQSGFVLPEKDRETIDFMLFQALDSSYGEYVKVTSYKLEREPAPEE